MHNEATRLAYIAGILDRNANFNIVLRDGSLIANITLGFINEKRALFFQKILNGTINSTYREGLRGDGNAFYGLYLNYQVLDELVPKLLPYTLKKNFSFYLEMRTLAGVRKIRVTDEMAQKRRDFYQRWQEYTETKKEYSTT